MIGYEMPLIALQELAKHPVDHIVSLGSSCDVAYNLRRYFDYSTAYPFDWWVSSGAGVMKVLAGADVKALYNQPSLTFQRNQKTERAAVFNKCFDISFTHEFPRDVKIPGGPVHENYQQYIPAAMERTEALIRRLFSLNGEGLRFLFVRRVLRSESADTREFQNLVETLSQAFSNVQFGLILVNSTLGRAQLGDAVSLHIPIKRSFGWKGDPDLWDASLATLAVSLRKGLHKPARKI